MLITFSSVRCPRWSDSEKKSIICFVKFDHRRTELPFAASPLDSEPYGREIFRRCLAGEFGPVADPIDDRAFPDPQASAVNIAGWPECRRFIDVANAENARGTTRGIILTWACMIDDLLGRVLESFLVQHSLAKELIWDDAASVLATFSGRTKMAFLLGLIDQEERTACDQIRKIRNRNAHEWEANLENAGFRKEILPCMEYLRNAYSPDLVFKEELEYLVKLAFAPACCVLALRLSQRVAEAEIVKRQLKQ